MTTNVWRWLCGLLSGMLWAAAANAQEDMMLDENVTWLASASQAVVPDWIDLAGPGTAGYSSDDLVVRLLRIDIKLSEDKVERTSTRVYHFVSEEGVRDYGNLRSYFDAGSDNLEFQHALLVDSIGDVHVVAPETVQIVPSETVSIFSDSRAVVLPLTGVDVGSTSIVVEKRTMDRGRDISPWGTTIMEQYGVPQERLEIFISWESPELKPQWHSELSNMSCTESDQGAVACVATDIPAYLSNENAYYDDVIPQFTAAEQASWSDVSDWYQPLFTSAISSDASITATAMQLSDGLDDETEILKKIHNFVAAQVRYVGLEHGDSAYVPHPTSETLKRRYGDCKDKAALLIDLLNQVGINMMPVLVSSSRRDPKKIVVPSGRYFDHLIVCGALSNGKQYCLDGTDPYSGIDSLSGWIQGAVAFPINEGSSLTVLPADEFRWVVLEDVDLTITAKGELKEVSAIEYANAYGSSIRGYLTGLTSDERQKWAMDDYHKAVSVSVDPEFRFSGIDETDRGVIVGWDTSYDDIASPTTNLEYIEYAAWLNQTIASLYTQNGEFDYRFSGFRFDSTATVRIDRHWQIGETGPEIDMQSKYGFFSREYETSNQTVTIRTRLEAPAALIDIDEVEDFNRFLEIVQQEGAFRVSGSLVDD